MYNNRTVGIFKRTYSDLKLYFTCRRAFCSLKETTANISQRDTARSNYLTNVRKLWDLTNQLIQHDGLDFSDAKKLTELLSNDFIKQISQKYKDKYHLHQTDCREKILFNLELNALNQADRHCSLRQIAGFECVMRTLAGCVDSPVVKSRLEHIRDTYHSKQRFVIAISEFLTQMHSGSNLLDPNEN